ncbi:MAG: HEAT repeat domain-containing protein [Vicinamibacterales bacterium]
MECEEVRNRLADHLNGGLEAQDTSSRAALVEHLAGCAACRAEAEALEDVWARLGEIPADLMNPAAMRERFDEMLDGYQQGLEDRRPARLWNGVNARLEWRRPIVQTMLAAALLVVGVVAGGAFDRLLPKPAPVPDANLTELRRELHDVREMLTLSLMQQQSATERLRGVSWSNEIDQPGNEIVSALLDTLLHDQNVNVRLAAVDALRRFSAQDSVRKGTVQALADAASSPLVQVALIDFMVETKDTEAVATLRRISRDSMVNEAVRGRAVQGLERLGS